MTPIMLVFAAVCGVICIDEGSTSPSFVGPRAGCGRSIDLEDEARPPEGICGKGPNMTNQEPTRCFGAADDLLMARYHNEE